MATYEQADKAIRIPTPAGQFGYSSPSAEEVKGVQNEMSDIESKLKASGGMVDTGGKTLDQIKQDLINAGFKPVGQPVPTPDDTKPVYTGTSAPEIPKETKTKGDLTNLINDNTNYKAQLDAHNLLIDKQQTYLEQRRANEINTINKQFETTKAGTEKAQVREKGATSVSLARIGGYLGNTASGTGAMLNLAESHRSELGALESKRQAAIQAANNAIDDKQFDLAKLKVTEARQIMNDIEDRKQKFFQNNLALLQEERAKATSARETEKASFNTAAELASGVFSDISGMKSESEINTYLDTVANKYKIDPFILRSNVSQLMDKQREATAKEVINLTSKYPGAEIESTDSLDSALQKIRNSPEYKLDIQKGELDVANTISLINSRAPGASNKPDYSDPIISIYTSTTGNLVNSTGEANGIIGYAKSLLGGREIVKDGTPNIDNDKQISGSDAAKIMSDAFRELNKTQASSAKDVWQWLSGEQAKNMSDSEKEQYIISEFGMDPNDFGFFFMQ